METLYARFIMKDDIYLNMKAITQEQVCGCRYTYPNHGAYYETGYALVLGKEENVCFHDVCFVSSDKNQDHILILLRIL